MPSVVNKRDVHAGNASVYIGRPSKWGNPFPLYGEQFRDEVVAKYEQHLLNSPELLAQLGELKGKDLVCWCAPKACHGDILLRLANE